MLLIELGLAFLERTNLTVTTLTASFLLYTRSTAVAYFVCGAVFCTFSVKLVKKLIRQPRPANIHGSKVKVSYGMPSTHSATITFYAAYILLACVYLPLHPSLSSNTALCRVLPPVAVMPWASMIVMSRVWLGHHTWPQVAVGCSYGIAVAMGWFYAWIRGLDVYGRELERLVV